MSYTQLRLTAVLLVVVTLSALAVVYSSFKSRQLFIELQSLQVQATRQQIQLGQLLLEEGAWSSLAMIEQVASDKLGMQAPANHSIVVTSLQPAGSPRSKLSMRGSH